jgi:hypothetical protein
MNVITYLSGAYKCTVYTQWPLLYFLIYDWPRATAAAQASHAGAIEYIQWNVLLSLFTSVYNPPNRQ